MRQSKLSLLSRIMTMRRHKLRQKVSEKMQLKATVKNHSSIRYLTP